MLNEFSLSRDRAMINFTLKYCDTSEKLLDSFGFRKVVEVFVKKLKKEEGLIYNFYLDAFGTDDQLADAMVEVFKLLTVFDINEVLKVENKYSIFFEDRNLFIELIELLYGYWRKLERFTIVRNNRLGEGLQSVRFIQANNNFNDLVLATYRRIEETVMGYQHRVYRQLIAGANAGLTLNDVNWNCPIEYRGLTTIPFIGSVVLQPPFISYTKRNTREGIFQEHFKNPLENIVLNEDDWFVYPAKVGDLLTFVYFHKDFMAHGLALANLFELAVESDYIGRKPDMIYLFGYPDGDNEKRTFYYNFLIYIYFFTHIMHMHNMICVA